MARPEDQAALRPVPPQSYEVCERTTRQVGKDCRFSFEGWLYSAPTELAGQRIALRIFSDRLCLYTLEPLPRALGAHSGVRQRGSLVEDPAHQKLRPPWPPTARALAPLGPLGTPLAQLDVPVVHRPLVVYALVGTGEEGSHE